VAVGAGDAVRIVLLDIAADADHVRDLLPGTGQSFVLITSSYNQTVASQRSCIR
jgi:hypothetical protein